MRELEAQAKFLAPVIAHAVKQALAPVTELLAAKDSEIAALTKRLDELPQPVAPEPVDLEALAKAAADLITLPDPVPGKDAEPVDLEALAKAAAALVVVPDPVPGKDAEPVDLAAVAALVEVPQPAEVDLSAVAALVTVPEVDVEAIARAAAALVPTPVVPQPEHGRDALDLEILPAIDETKQYPRGTYAAHRGGLWKSYERTHGLRGWECIVDGIADVTVTNESERDFSVTLSKSSGQEVVEKFHMPVMIYKGVWKPCVALPGDTFTFGGSLWHCDEPTGDKPGESKAWTLAAKRGKDGKEVVSIPREPIGVVKL